jgi:hypothetical protein
MGMVDSVAVLAVASLVSAKDPSAIFLMAATSALIFPSTSATLLLIFAPSSLSGLASLSKIRSIPASSAESIVAAARARASFVPMVSETVLVAAEKSWVANSLVTVVVGLRVGGDDSAGGRL